MPARLVKTGGWAHTLRLIATLSVAALTACATPPQRQAADEPKAERINPVRGQAEAIASGEKHYARHCASCHGEGATKPGPAADLRNIGRTCRRLTEPGLQQRCHLDADVYFLKTVEEGKLRLGIRHMPAWKDLISTEEAWAIQAFIETRPR